MEKGKVCNDCPNVVERREADASYRSMVLTKLEGYDKVLPEIKTSIDTLISVTQKNFNTIYFRMGMISGTIGIITGTVATMATLHLNR